MEHDTENALVRTVTAFRWVPEIVQGLVRDIRVRWALEEAGLAYTVKLIDFEERTGAAHRAVQPFGQIPVYQEGALTLFESGAIVHHIAMQSAVLMPVDTAARSHTLTWMFAALNTIEPAVQALAELDLFAASAPWAAERRAAIEPRVATRLAELEGALESRDYLLERFTAADILLATVLRSLRHTDLVSRHQALHAYLARCNARPAARKALADHLAAFRTAQ